VENLANTKANSRDRFAGEICMYWYGDTKSWEDVPLDIHLAENAHRVLVHSAAEAAAILDKLESWMRILGFPNKDIFAVKLAVHEALINALRHGNRWDPSKCVRVAFLVTPAEVLVGVEDQGPGFDPASVPNPLSEEILDRPGGRGLFLMRAYASWVSFEPPGNRVTLCRRRSDPAGAPQGGSDKASGPSQGCPYV